MASWAPNAISDPILTQMKEARAEVGLRARACLCYLKVLAISNRTAQVSKVTSLAS